MRIGIFLATLRGSFTRHVAEMTATNLFLLLLLAGITFYPLFFVGFTTRDDAGFGNFAFIGESWHWLKAVSADQGRINFYWTYPLMWLPYAIDNRAWYLFIKYGSLFLLLCSLYFAIFKTLKSNWIALTSLVFFVTFIQNGWEHNALVSYPGLFNILAALFLVSLGLFSIAIERKKLPLAIFSGVLYFLSLGVELFVLFFPFYVAVLLSHTPPNESVIRRVMLGKKYILTVLLPLLAYLAIYLAWRNIHPSSYTGNNLDGFNLLAAGKVLVTYSLSAFPIASLQFIIYPDYPISPAYQFANPRGFLEILSQLNTAHFIKPVVAGFIFARLMTSAQFIVPQARTLKIGAALAFVGIFLPNLLLSFTQRHQSWLASGTHSYLYTYYSFISAVVFSALVLAYLKAKSQSWNTTLRLSLGLMGIVAIMALSFAVEVRNQYVAFDQKLSYRKSQLMDVVIKSTAFKEIPDGSTVVAPTLTAHIRGIALASASYWSTYIRFKTGKNVQLVDTKCNIGVPCYSLVFRQEAHSDNQFIVLAKISKPNTMAASELTIYSMPNRNGAVLFGSLERSEIPPKLEIDGVPVANIGSEAFSSNLFQVSGDGLVQTAMVTGNADIIPERITISHYSVEPRLRPLSAELAEGIDFKKQDYPEFLAEVSGMSGYEAWGRWTDAAAGPAAKFRFKQALPKQFTLAITANAFGPNNGEPVKVRAGGIEKTFVITTKKEADTYSLVFETDGIADSLEITPPKPISPNEIDPKNGDTRKLGIALLSLRIKELNPQN